MRPWLACLLLAASPAAAQFANFLGGLLGRQPQGGDQPRIDLGAIAGGLLNNINNNRNKQQDGTTRRPNIVEGLLGAAVGAVVDNTDINVGLDGNGQLAVSVLPKRPAGAGSGPGEECPADRTGVRSGLGAGLCDCWETGVDYSGADLTNLAQNPIQVSRAADCQKKCQVRSA